MNRMYTGPLRSLRALLLSATCVALSLGAHLVDAGSGVETDLANDVAMAFTHAAAALLIGIGLATGETALERDKRLAPWRHPGILADLVVLQCLSRRGPPELALAA